jgi:hypothetical protein
MTTDPALRAPGLESGELDAIRQRDANARHPAATWTVHDRRMLLIALDAALAAEAAPLDVGAMWQWRSTLRADHVLMRGPSHGIDGQDWIGGTCAVCRGLAELYRLTDAALRSPDTETAGPHQCNEVCAGLHEPDTETAGEAG